MSTGYETNGRTAQKRRTRDALVAAARDLVAQGLTPTVQDAAEAASISRTTAYRYFATQGALLAAAHPHTAWRSALPENPPHDVAARLDLVLTATSKMLLEFEPQQRTMLRLSLEAEPDERAQLLLRHGRVITWLEEALEPLHDSMADDDRHRLALAIRSATGIEALAWLTDVGGLSRADAVELMRWSAHAMLDAAQADASQAARHSTS